MKNAMLSLVLILGAFMTNAQVKISDDFTYSISNPYQVVDAGIKQYFSKDGQVLSLKYSRGKFYFQKFGGDKLNEVKREIVEKSTGFTAEDFIEHNGRFYFMFSIWDRDAQKEQLYMREIDFESCQFVDEGERIITVDGKVSGGFSIFGGTGGDKFNVTQSFDHSRLIIQYRRVPEEKRDALNKDIIGMNVFDGDMNLVWAKDVEMPYTEKKMNNVAFTIDKSGNAYVLAQVYEDGSTRARGKDGEANYHLELIKVEAKNQDVTTSKVDLDGKYMSAVGFFEGKTGEIVIAGYYGNKYVEATDGLFMFKLQDDGSLTDKVSYEIPVDVMKQYMSERAQDRLEKKDDKKDLYMTNMVLRDICFDKDGSITIYGEKYFVKTSYNSKTGQTTYTYYYQEILAARIDGEGELAWMNKLPKNQIGGSAPGGMGYYLINGEDYDYVLFLDNVRNIELPLTSYPKAHRDGRGGYLTGFKITNDSGELEKVSILNTAEAKGGIALYQFATSRIVQISDNEFAIECYKKGKEDVMVKVTMTE